MSEYYWGEKWQSVEFNSLVGQTIVSITGAEKDGELVVITTDSGTYHMVHDQDCCESVTIAEVHSDPNDLIGGVVHSAEENTNEGEGDPPSEYSDSWTWTFYRLITDKGTLVIRWLGESNGYYSESVSIYKKIGEDSDEETDNE